LLRGTSGYDEEDLRQDHTKRKVEYFLQNKPFSKNQRMSFDPFIICLYLLKVCWLSFTLNRQNNFSPANIHWVLRFFIQSTIDFSYKTTLSCHFFSWIDWKSPLVFSTPFHNKQNCSFPEKTAHYWHDMI
jgi:hypothetical protein